MTVLILAVNESQTAEGGRGVGGFVFNIQKREGYHITKQTAQNKNWRDRDLPRGIASVLYLWPQILNNAFSYTFIYKEKILKIYPLLKHPITISPKE